ncbi:unnamed protein product [Phytophthora fragariaefolia]|uniref:Unnamed protein product n=1 Tax=Phytophthora fragariaefolia TaxID=1490495 RepID=A0A9W6YMN7_9STRA|nr:unnamed protein product [Phytophthora fragariaefolia]
MNLDVESRSSTTQWVACQSASTFSSMKSTQSSNTRTTSCPKSTRRWKKNSVRRVSDSFVQGRVARKDFNSSPSQRSRRKQQPSFCALCGKSRFDGVSEKDASDTRPVILLVDKKWAEKGGPFPQVVLPCRHPEGSGVWTSSLA